MIQVTHIGLGRVGLPQALVACDAGYQVHGIDQNSALVAELSQGRLPFSEPGLAELLERHLGRGFFPLTPRDLGKAIPGSDCIVLAISLPYPQSALAPDLEGLHTLAAQVFRLSAKPGALLVCRVTVPPGTTEALKQSIERESGLKEGRDFYLAFVPERVAEGRAVEEERTLPRLLSAFSQKGLRRVEAFYRPLGSPLIRMSSPRAAELAKLADNAFRSTLFSFANDLSLVAEEHGVDALEVIHACNYSYSRNSIPLPGPVSGTCLGKDPYLLESSAGMEKKRGFGSVWFQGRRANDSLVGHAVDSLLEKMKGCGDSPQLLVLGLSYKEGVDDFRMSHSLDLVRLWLNHLPRSRVSVYDPALGKGMYARLPADLEEVVKERHNQLSPEIFRGKDAVVLATRHRELAELSTLPALERLLAERKKPLIIYDWWNLWREAAGLEGVVYLALGYVQPGHLGAIGKAR